MSLNHLTHYNFSTEHGITGNLACDPVFVDDKDGNEFAKITLFCRAQDKTEHHHKKRRRADQSHNLVAFVRIYDDSLLDQVESLKKGYFVNFTFDSVTFAIGDDEETGELGMMAFVNANGLTIRHIPGQPAKNDDAKTTRTVRKSPVKKASTRRKKSA